MNNKSKKFSFFYLVVFSILIIGISSGFSLVKESKSVFEIKDERFFKDYLVKTEKGTNSGTLYELDVLFTSEVTSEMINEFVENIDIPEDVVSINVKFYNNYDDNSETQKYKFLKYEISKIL